jgi:hypothetical protein
VWRGASQCDETGSKYVCIWQRSACHSNMCVLVQTVQGIELLSVHSVQHTHTESSATHVIQWLEQYSHDQKTHRTYRVFNVVALRIVVQ